jgi:hypothetical protein
MSDTKENSDKSPFQPAKKRKFPTKKQDKNLLDDVQPDISFLVCPERAIWSLYQACVIIPQV